MRTRLDVALKVFACASAYTATSRWLRVELNWQRAAAPTEFREPDFLREAAWVILCGGFRESVVRRKFGYISLCFCDWESAVAIIKSAIACRAAALAAISNATKIDAILAVAQRVVDSGFARLKEEIIMDPIEKLQELPFVGPTTSWHLAKNLGFRVAKPDRHLSRLSEFLGFENAHELCDALSRSVREQVNVVDLILWRYAADGFPCLTPSIARRMTAFRQSPISALKEKTH